MPDSARTLAIDMVEDAGWLVAVAFSAKLLARARSWHTVGRGLRLLLAVVFV